MKNCHRIDSQIASSASHHHHLAKEK
uniref:Uncharacterized protein n=1 Tax=Rhizophora mucronata TaxID=61149 RepID=A0A2P2PTE9_RHIMU